MLMLQQNIFSYTSLCHDIEIQWNKNCEFMRNFVILQIYILFLHWLLKEYLLMISRFW